MLCHATLPIILMGLQQPALLFIQCREFLIGGTDQPWVEALFIQGPNFLECSIHCCRRCRLHQIGESFHFHGVEVRGTLFAKHHRGIFLPGVELQHQGRFLRKQSLQRPAAHTPHLLAVLPIQAGAQLCGCFLDQRGGLPASMMQHTKHSTSHHSGKPGPCVHNAPLPASTAKFSPRGHSDPATSKRSPPHSTSRNHSLGRGLPHARRPSIHLHPSGNAPSIGMPRSPPHRHLPGVGSSGANIDRTRGYCA